MTLYSKRCMAAPLISGLFNFFAGDRKAGVLDLGDFGVLQCLVTRVLRCISRCINTILLIVYDSVDRFKVGSACH